MEEFVVSLFRLLAILSSVVTCVGILLSRKNENADTAIMTLCGGFVLAVAICGSATAYLMSGNYTMAILTFIPTIIITIIVVVLAIIIIKAAYD